MALMMLMVPLNLVWKGRPWKMIVALKGESQTLEVGILGWIIC